MSHHKTFKDDPKLPPALVARTFKLALGVGIAGLGASVAGLAAGVEKSQFFFSYLVAVTFGTSIAVAALFFTMLQHLVRAGWSAGVRRIAENLAGTLPVMAVLFIPVIVGLHEIYHWSHPEAVKVDPILEWKSGYLNTPFFIARTIFYFAVWSALAWYFRSHSVRQDQTGDEALTFKMRKLAPIGVLTFALTISFAAFDWMMSTDPHWFSTMFGVYTFAGAVVGFFAFLGLAALWITKNGALTNTITTGNLHDIAKQQFGFTVFWAYVTFCQYFLIWYANIPEETIWYSVRQENGWDAIFKLIIVGHFIVPFWVLMSRHMKRNRTVYGLVAGWMLFMHYIDMYFQAMPVHSHHLHFHWMDATCLIGVVGILVAAFVRKFQSDAAVAHKDPMLVAAMNYDNF